MKTCKKCWLVKEPSEFYKVKTTRDKLDTICKSCRTVQHKEYYQNNKERERLRGKLYRTNNKEKIFIKHKIYREKRDKNKEWAYQREYYAKNIERMRLRKSEQHRERRKNNPVARIAHTLRSQISRFVKSDYKKAGSAVQDLGCTIEELKVYLETKFKPAGIYSGINRPSMSWSNYGGKSGWQIDHIIPLAKIDLTNREQFLIASNYINLQPLWPEENKSKSDNLPEQLFF